MAMTLPNPLDGSEHERPRKWLRSGANLLPASIP
jgi:hypothetical protein